MHARLRILRSSHNRRPVHALRRLRCAVEGLWGAATAAAIARRFDGADGLRAVFVGALVANTADIGTAERVRQAVDVDGVDVLSGSFIPEKKGKKLTFSNFIL